MSIAVVTSCSAAGYAKYGLRFLDTFHKHWPKEVALYLVSEDQLPIPPFMTDRSATSVSLVHDAPPDVRNFYTQHAQNKRAHGVPEHAARRLRNGYDFRTDAWKFSKKVFAINLAAGCTQADKLIWLDADVVTFADVPLSLFDTLPPSDCALACLDRGSYHSECGFVSYNLAHSGTRHFINDFQMLYTSGAVFALPEWHDSFVFDWLRKQTGIATYKIPHKSSGHPFVYSVLGTYMDHLKGNRKQHGVSRDHPRFRRPPPWASSVRSRRR